MSGACFAPQSVSDSSAWSVPPRSDPSSTIFFLRFLIDCESIPRFFHCISLHCFLGHMFMPCFVDLLLLLLVTSRRPLVRSTRSPGPLRLHLDAGGRADPQVSDGHA